MQRITLIDVARAAGVSTASASRALSGRTPVTPELHARIMAAAGRLGYRAHWAAKALASNRSGLVGVAVRGGTEFETICGLEQRLDEAGYGCLVAFAPKAAARARVLPGLIGRGIEALVLLGEPPLAQEIESLGTLPWIAIAEDGEGGPWRIELGRAAGAELATRYLRELDHERFAVLGASDGGTARGVARALQGGTFSIPDVYEAGSDSNRVKRAVHSLIDLAKPPTALVCESDTVALITARECILRGVRVPKDVSVVGFGDEPFARAALPSLTTVRNGTTTAGRYAADAVLALLAGRPVEPYRPSVKLAIRESTGPAPPG